ncbi:MAG: hypothetical protein ABI690_27935 [Chloroflexota bacterium]
MRVPNMGEVCFVLMPIGDEESDIRRDSDRVLNEIVRPAADRFGYHLVRSDNLLTPEVIHKDSISQLADAQLAIANLTGKNAKVFYELAFRHTLEKPVILICAQGEVLPFDPTIYNVIWFDLNDDASIARCTEAIIQRMEASAEALKSGDNPIAKLIDVQQLRANTAITVEDVRKAFEKVPDLAHFKNYTHDLKILVERLRQNNIKTKGQLVELMSRGILDAVRTLYLEELNRRIDIVLDPEGIAVWGSYFVQRGVTPDTLGRVRKAMTGFPEYQRTHGDLVIFEGRYGVDSNWRDVTDILRSGVTESRLELLVANETFRRKLDPARWNPSVGVTKHLEVQYAYKNQHFFREYLEGEKLELPTS